MKKTDTKSVSIRIPTEILPNIRYISDYEGRSLNSQVVYLIRKCISDFENEHGKINIDTKT